MHDPVNGPVIETARYVIELKDLYYFGDVHRCCATGFVCGSFLCIIVCRYRFCQRLAI